MKYRSSYIPCFFIASLFFMFNACDTSNDTDQLPTYIIDVSGETFRVQIANPDIARAADSLLANGIAKIVHGFIQAGNGGFNAPYNWHLDPDRISFPDLTIELCDGRPGPIDDDLDYWINTVGIYCPWGAQITGKE